MKTGDRERLPKPPTEGALGRPDSRSVIVHFLLECGPFLGPLWPTPSYSPSFSPRSFLPHHPSWVRSVRARGNKLAYRLLAFHICLQTHNSLLFQEG